MLLKYRFWLDAISSSVCSHRGNPAFVAELALIGPKSNMRAFPLHDRKNSSLTKAGIQKSHPFPIEKGDRNWSTPSPPRKSARCCLPSSLCSQWSQGGLRLPKRAQEQRNPRRVFRLPCTVIQGR